MSSGHYGIDPRSQKNLVPDFRPIGHPSNNNLIRPQTPFGVNLPTSRPSTTLAQRKPIKYGYPPKQIALSPNLQEKKKPQQTRYNINTVFDLIINDTRTKTLHQSIEPHVSKLFNAEQVFLWYVCSSNNCFFAPTKKQKCDIDQSILSAAYETNEVINMTKPSNHERYSFFIDSEMCPTLYIPLGDEDNNVYAVIQVMRPIGKLFLTTDLSDAFSLSKKFECFSHLLFDTERFTETANDIACSRDKNAVTSLIEQLQYHFNCRAVEFWIGDTGSSFLRYDLSVNTYVRIIGGNPGVIIRAFQNHEVLNIYDCSQCEEFNEEIDGDLNEPILAIPYVNELLPSAIVLRGKINSDHFTYIDEIELKALTPLILKCLSTTGSGSSEEFQNRLKALLGVAEILGGVLDIDTLLPTIMERARLLLNTERCSLFLVDSNREMLITTFQRGLDESIKMPISKGIVGHTATTGEIVNISDAYQDPRFDDAIDQKTGFNTKTILTVPIYNNRGEIAGVTEMINKNGNLNFNDDDIKMMVAFNVFCGISLDNAQLYKTSLELTRQLKGFVEMSSALNKTKTLHEILEEILTNAKSVINANRATLFMKEEDSNILNQFVSIGDSPIYGSKLAEKILQTRELRIFTQDEIQAMEISIDTIEQNKKNEEDVKNSQKEQKDSLDEARSGQEAKDEQQKKEQGKKEEKPDTEAKDTQKETRQEANGSRESPKEPKEIEPQGTKDAQNGAKTEEQEAKNEQQEAKDSQDGTKTEQQESKTDQQEAKDTQNDTKIEQQKTKDSQDGIKTEQQESKTEQQEAKTEQQESKDNQNDAKTELQEAKTEQQEAKTDQKEAKNEQQEAKTEQQEAKTEQQESKDSQNDTKTEQQENKKEQPEAKDSPSEVKESFPAASTTSPISHDIHDAPKEIFPCSNPVNLKKNDNSQSSRRSSRLVFAFESDSPSSPLQVQQTKMICDFPLLTSDECIIGVLEISTRTNILPEDIKLLECFVVFASVSIERSELQKIASYGSTEVEMKKYISETERSEIGKIPSKLEMSSEDQQRIFRLNFDAPLYDGIGHIRVIWEIFDHFKLLSEYKITNEKFFAFLSTISNTYNKVPYHNWRHAVDVTQFATYEILTAKLDTKWTKFELFGFLVSAICHDANHDGFTNVFNEKAETPLGILFKNQSVMETHHCSVTIGVISKEECNIFHALNPNEIKLIWNQIIKLILSTDMAKHYDILKSANAILDKGPFDMNDDQHRMMTMQLTLKCADISNVSRPFELANKWCDVLCEEFFRQGDLEMTNGMEYTSPLNDRAHLDKPKSQIGFYTYVCLPLYETTARGIPELIVNVNQVKSNLEVWKSNIEQANN